MPDQKTVLIEYIDLKTTEKDSTQIKNDLRKIIEFNGFDKSYPEFTIISKKIYKKGTKLNAKLKFSYRQSKDLDHLYFHTDSSENINYPILEDEKTIYSNGKLFKSKEINWFQWTKNEKIIKLTLKRRNVDKNEISLVKYYKK